MNNIADLAVGSTAGVGVTFAHDDSVVSSQVVGGSRKRGKEEERSDTRLYIS